MNQPLVAVVVLNWNGRKHLETFLPALVATAYAGAEIWVADNCSTDDSVAFTRANYPSIKILEMPDNAGFAGGYNRALSQIKADYYVLLNSDVEVTPDWLDKPIALLESDPDVGAVQPKIRSWENKHSFEYAGAAGGMMDQLGYPFCRGRLLNVLEEDKGQYDSQIEIFWASGAALFVRSKLYHQLGGLDKDFFAHMEEIDLCWRIRRCGYKIYCCPESIVYHLGGGSLAQGSPQKVFLNFRNNLRMLIKNERGSKLIWLLPVRFGLDKIAALRELLTGNFGGFKAIVKAIVSNLFQLPYWFKQRKRNQLLIKAAAIGADRSKGPGYFRGSIILNFFFGGKKKWSELKNLS